MRSHGQESSSNRQRPHKIAFFRIRTGFLISSYHGRLLLNNPLKICRILLIRPSISSRSTGIQNFIQLVLIFVFRSFVFVSNFVLRISYLSFIYSLHAIAFLLFKSPVFRLTFFSQSHRLFFDLRRIRDEVLAFHEC